MLLRWGSSPHARTKKAASCRDAAFLVGGHGCEERRGFDAEPKRGVSERNRRSRHLARRRPHARTSSSQATYRLRRAILFHKWLISRSFCFSSLSVRKLFIGLRTEFRHGFERVHTSQLRKKALRQRKGLRAFFFELLTAICSAGFMIALNDPNWDEILLTVAVCAVITRNNTGQQVFGLISASVAGRSARA